ncbi:MAG: Fic/DOC family N-terminal domain-containing protein [Dehalococcoidia bacterium]
MRPLGQQEAVLSSRIEGTHTEIDEVALHEAGAAPAAPEDSDLFEVLNYLRALDYGRQWVRDGRPINPTFIRALHRELLRGVR